MTRGQRIRIALAFHKVTGPFIAKKCGISRQMMNFIVNDKQGGERHLPAIAGAIGDPSLVPWFMDGSNPPAWALAPSTAPWPEFTEKTDPPPITVDVPGVGAVQAWLTVGTISSRTDDQRFGLRLEQWYMADKSQPNWRCDLVGNTNDRKAFSAESELREWIIQLVLAQKSAGGHVIPAPKRVRVDNGEITIILRREWAFEICEGMQDLPDVGASVWVAVAKVDGKEMLRRTHVDQNMAFQNTLNDAISHIQDSGGWKKFMDKI